MRLYLKRLKNAELPTRWDLGNEVLYRLCEQHPLHTNEDEILAKIWLVRRSYSAAIERRRESRKIGGEALLRYSRPTIENCVELIDTHKRLTDLFRDITGLEKRSLASKYLHFHFRNLFYIYDSRAAQSLATSSPIEGLAGFKEL
jgi:hypothetical protein